MGKGFALFTVLKAKMLIVFLFMSVCACSNNIHGWGMLTADEI